MKLGGFTFVLHSHMPFYRGAGKWPHGEENLHEVMAETYVPLLEALTDLHEQGIAAGVTLGMTPILAEQLADPLIISNFERYLVEEIEGATADVRRFEQRGQVHFLYLAHFYVDWYTHVYRTFRERFKSDMTGGFRRLQEAGAIEVLTSAATHAYLPLMQRDSTIDAQLEIGRRASLRHFGREPRAIWLPECAYRPSYYETASDGTTYKRPGIENWLQRRGLRLFFSESGPVEDSRVLGIAEFDRREVVRPTLGRMDPASTIYNRSAQRPQMMEFESARPISHRRVVPLDNGGLVRQASGTFQPYYVRESAVSVMGRNRRMGEQVWSAQSGYPGDPEYREFHRKDAEHGLQYWRVTDSKLDLTYKQPYDPYKAARRVEEHAAHFVSLLEEQLRSYNESSGGQAGFIASAYDTELFGHWWFEGVQFIKAVITRLARHESIELACASDWLEAHEPSRVIDLPESSWGQASTHITWLNPETTWMWDAVHAAERRMESVVERFPSADGDLEAALNQAARELVLLEASDWEFLYTTGQARQYATDRFVEHANRFNALADAVEEDAEEAARRAREYGARDNPFPDIDYRLFAKRQPN